MSHFGATTAIALWMTSLTPYALAAPVPGPLGPGAAPGSRQSPVAQAILGRPYVLGIASPITVTLNSAEYATDRVRIGDDAEIPKADKKYLVLHYTLGNPRTVEQTVRQDIVLFTAVDAAGAKHDADRSVGDESTGEELNVSLKPGQKVNAYSYIIVPAKGPVPKLNAKAADGHLVLQYDLKGKVKRLTGPTLDPAAKDGASALSEVPAEFGKTYQVGVFDVTMLSAVYTGARIQGQEQVEGTRNLVVTATFRNAHPQAQLLRYDSFTAKCADRNGAEISTTAVLLDASRNEPFSTNISYGKEATVWLCLQMDAKQPAARLSISHYTNDRAFVYDLRALK